MSADNRDPIAAAESLEQSMGALADEMRSLSDYGHRSRTLIWGLVVSLALDVVLSVILGIVALQASDASHRATEATSVSAQNALNAKVTCEVGNESRRLQIQLWTYVLDLSSTDPSQTPQQKQQVAQFREYIKHVYSPRDCATTPTATPPTVTPSR